MRHTQGEWKIDVSSQNEIVIFSPWSKEVTPGNTATFGDYRGAHVCSIAYNSGVPTKEQALANAQLIASAPELLEALKKSREILKCYEEGSHESVLPKALVLTQEQANYIVEIDEAIAKATNNL